MGDRTETGVGGGVCQVSTTLFRAFFFAGLPILERHAHSYQVAYYKPPGLDAAVIQPYKDLKVLNDTPGALWIQASVQEGRLRFHLFGTKDREVAWEGPFITDRKPPSPPGDPRPHPSPGGAQAGGLRRRRGQGGGPPPRALRGRARPGGPGGERLPPLGAVYLVGPSPAPEAPPAPPEEAGAAP